MKMKPYYVVIGLLAMALVLGCASKQKSTTDRLLDDEKDDVDLVAELTGIDDDTPVPMEPDEEEQPANHAEEPLSKDEDFIGGTDGAFVGKILISGAEAPGTYDVRTATESALTVQQGVKAGTEITLAPGMYDFSFSANTVAGRPEVSLRDVEIVAGRRLRKEVKIPVGEITLVTGSRCQKTAIRIKPADSPDWYGGKYFTCVPILLMAGEYEAELSNKRERTPIKGIQVYDGSVRNIMIHSQ
jgi:hypothetical protein